MARGRRNGEAASISVDREEIAQRGGSHSGAGWS
jgi:general stress protein YciG